MSSVFLRTDVCCKQTDIDDEAVHETCTWVGVHADHVRLVEHPCRRCLRCAVDGDADAHFVDIEFVILDDIPGCDLALCVQCDLQARLCKPAFHGLQPALCGPLWIEQVHIILQVGGDSRRWCGFQAYLALPFLRLAPEMGGQGEEPLDGRSHTCAGSASPRCAAGDAEAPVVFLVADQCDQLF